MKMRFGSFVLVLACSALAMTLACASSRGNARVGAVTFSHLAHDVKVTEDQVFAAKIPGYDKAEHLKVQQGIKKLLIAASAYDSAVHDWPVGAKTTDAVLASQKALNDALTELSKAIPAVVAVQEPLNRGINALRAALASQSAGLRLEDVTQAQLPPGGAAGILALLQVALGLFQAGKMTFGDLAGFLKKHDATDEELDAAKALVDADVADIDKEAAEGQ